MILLVAAFAEPATARDCAHRLTVGPMAVAGVPAWTALPLPFGGRLRFDGVLLCPEPGSDAIAPGTVALNVDVAVGSVWAYHDGGYPSFRQQVGLHVEPWGLTDGPARGAYLGARFAVAWWFLRPTWVRTLPSAVIGYRFEPDGPVTVQVGAGATWRNEEGLFPILELRCGALLGGRRSD